MKLNKRQLRRIIREEKANILADDLMTIGKLQRQDRLDELSLSGFVSGAKGLMRGVTDFKKGVETFLESNKEWLIPTYNTVARLINKNYDYDLPMLDENMSAVNNKMSWREISKLGEGDIEPHTGERIVGVEAIEETGLDNPNDPNGEILAVFELASGKTVEYHYDAAHLETTDIHGREIIEQLPTPKITVNESYSYYSKMIRENIRIRKQRARRIRRRF